MTYYKTPCQLFVRSEGKPAFVVGEGGDNILALIKSETVLVPVHRYVCDLDLAGETLEDRPDLRERGILVAKAMFRAALEERLLALRDVTANPPYSDLTCDPYHPITLVVVEKEPADLMWDGNAFHGTATFGVAAFGWYPKELEKPPITPYHLPLAE